MAFIEFCFYSFFNLAGRTGIFRQTDWYSLSACRTFSYPFAGHFFNPYRIFDQYFQTLREK